MGVTRNILNWYAKLSPKYAKSTPPYKHVVQIGDPTLRKSCEQVPIDKIKSNEVITVIKTLEFVMNKYRALGMSAPQIGVNMRIFVMQLKPAQIGSIPKEVVKSRGMEAVPYTVYINPKLKILNYNKLIQSEGCESVQGYIADVPRYKEIEVTGYNEHGVLTTNVYKDWSARIVQHELDHLDGKLYVDIMDRKTMTCVCWEEVNLARGNIVIPFYPK